MADLDYAPVMLDDEEDQLRKRNPYDSAPPVKPPAAPYEANHPGDVTPGVGRARGELASKPPDIAAAPIPEAPAITASVQPRAPTPAANAYEALRAKGPAWGREGTGGRILDVLGNATNIGQSIERGTGLGSLGYQSQLGAARTAADDEAQRAQEESRTQQMDIVPMKVPWSDQPIYVQRKDVGAIQRQIGQGATAKDIAGGKEASAEKIATGKEASTEKIATGKEASTEKIAGQKIKSAEDIAQANRESRERIATGHNLASTEIARIRAAAGNDPNKLTNTMKTMKQQAQATLPGIDRALDETEKVANLLGPVTGRWNDFMTGKIGGGDPVYKHYKDEIGMVQSAVTLAHARGRMSNELFEHFERMFDAGKLSPQNMIQALNVAHEWLSDYATMGEGPGGGAAPAAAPQRPKGVPEGAVWNDKVRRWQMPTAKPQ